MKSLLFNPSKIFPPLLHVKKKKKPVYCTSYDNTNVMLTESTDSCKAILLLFYNFTTNYQFFPHWLRGLRTGTSDMTGEKHKTPSVSLFIHNMFAHSSSVALVKEPLQQRAKSTFASRS